MQRDLRHTMVLAAGVGLSGLVSSLYLIFAARQLGPPLYAELTAGIALGTLTAYSFGWTTMVIGQASARFASRGEGGKIRGLTGRFVVALLIGAAAVAPLVMLLAPRIVDLLRLRSRATVMAAFGLVVSVLFVSGVRAALRGAQRFTAYSVGSAAEATLRLAVGMALITVFAEPAAGIVAYIIAAGVIGAASWIVVRKLGPPTPIDRSEMRRLSVLVLPAVAIVVTLAGFHNIDVLFVKRYFTASEAGIYAAASTAGKVMVMLALPFDALLLPRLAYLREVDAQRVPSTVLRIAIYCVALGAAALSLLAGFARQVVDTLYGPRFAAAAPLLLPLAAFLFMLYLSYFACQILITIHRFRWIALFVAGLATEIGAIALMHDSPARVAHVVVFNQALTLLALVVAVIVELPRSHATAGVELSTATELTPD